MNYTDITEGLFIDRPNRFIANVEINGKKTVCHVKNTGRCKELLISGTKVYLQHSDNPSRKTEFDLIAVEKGNILINIDSAAPHQAAAEYIRKIFGENAVIKQEVKYGTSRIDFFIESNGEKWFIEVKGVTLEQNGRAYFPDAPTLRGVKHLNELCAAVKEGYRACALFIIQMKGVSAFSPNNVTHPEFGKALKRAAESGVIIKAVDCLVAKNGMTADKEVEVIL